MTGTEPCSVIVYDGECAFCQAQVKRIRRRDTRNLFEYLPRQTPGIEQRFPGLAEAEFNSGMRLIYPDGQIFDVITNGSGLMQGYRYPISAEDRWAIVAYVRRLQEERRANQ